MVSYIDSYKVPNTVGSLSHVSETFWKDNKVNFFEKACHGDKAWGKIAIGISLLAGVIFVLYNKWHDIQHYMPFTIAGKVFYHFKRDEILFTNLRSSIQNKGLPGAQVEIQKWLTDRAKLSPSDFSLDI